MKIVLSRIIVILTMVVMVSCTWISKRQNLKGFYGKKFCLNVEATDSVNNITVGKGTLTLNEDMTFDVKNDSPIFSNIKGTWDLCCYASDYGNFIFKVTGMPDWKTDAPDFYVKIHNKEVKLIFKVCN